MSADERDIVERLNAYREILREVDQRIYQGSIPTRPGPTQAFKDAELVSEAAAEITRLRAEREILLKNSRDLLANAELFERKQDEAEDALAALRRQVVEATGPFVAPLSELKPFPTMADVSVLRALHNACKEGE